MGTAFNIIKMDVAFRKFTKVGLMGMDMAFNKIKTDVAFNSIERFTERLKESI